MRKPAVWLWTLAALSGVVLVVVGYVLLRPLPEADPSSATTDGRTETATVTGNDRPASDSGLPPQPGERSQASIEDSATDVSPDAFAQLVIPSLNVEAPVHKVGMSTDPSDPKYLILSPPADPATVGWWKGGAAPGSSKGSAILVGHTRRISGVEGMGDGALGYLSRLRPGSDVAVDLGDRTVDYRVTDVVRNLDFGAVAESAGSIYDPEYPGGRLVLITCWSDGEKFTGNTFVYAEPL